MHLKSQKKHPRCVRRSARPKQRLVRSSGLQEATGYNLSARSTHLGTRSIERPLVDILTTLLDPAQQSIFSTSSLRFITPMFKSHTLIPSLLQELFHQIQHTLSYSIKTPINLLYRIPSHEFTHECIINWCTQVTVNLNSSINFVFVTISSESSFNMQSYI